MLSKDQKQDVGESATAVQAGNDAIVQVTHNYGLSYSEVRQIALDTYKANFYELAGAAKETARARAEEITEEFLNKLQDENPRGFLQAEEPDFQHGLFTVQKEYARTGDKELGDILVDLLVDRSKQDERNILQIVLNESLSVAPKLTNSQLAILALIFRLRYTVAHTVVSHDSLGQYFDENVFPFIEKITTNEASFQHLEFAGCGTRRTSEANLERLLGIIYKGMFAKGFDKSEIDSKQITIGSNNRYFISCLNDNTKLQVNATSEEVLKALFEEDQIGEEDRKKIIELFNLNVMSDNEIMDFCIKLRPYMQGIFDKWNSSPMNAFNLTSVGIAIGHANIKKLRGNFTDLSIWIN